MVLFKRKPVQYTPNATPQIAALDDLEVWVIPQTGELFLEYDDYLRRRDYYAQKKFTCEITGHTNLTFWEALESETDGSRELDTNFPDALREPVLRKVQFSTISRIDDLVTYVFDEFKDHFYPGEHVIVLLEDSSRVDGVVRDKIIHAPRHDEKGKLCHSRYFIQLDNQPGYEAFADNNHLTRDRRVFTKMMLRSFLKNALKRESWAGAPWLVKEKLAKEYKISTDVPPDLRYDARMAEKKANAAAKKQEAASFIGFMATDGQGSPLDIKPALKGRNRSLPIMEKQQHITQFLQPFQNGHMQGQMASFPANQQLQQVFNQPYAHHLQQYPHFQPIAASTMPQKELPPPPPKYPCEDLEIQMRKNGGQRPELKYFAKADCKEDYSGPVELEMESVGPLLEIWNTLNVHVEVYKLDSFTFDDFVEALNYSSVAECELLIEVHCAILKMLVNEQGDVQVTLPLMEDDDEDDDEEEQEDSTLTTPMPEPEEKRPVRTTRRSLAKAEAEAQKEKSPSPEEDKKIHRASELFGERTWVDRLKERDFRDGGWIVVLVGLLHQLSFNERRKKTCDAILAHLVPPIEEPTEETVCENYTTLDLNLRVAALEMACMLSIQTKAIRNYLDECSEDMTKTRKEKIDFQRQRKVLMEEHRQLHEERKMLAPEHLPASPPPEADGELEREVSQPTEDAEATVLTNDGSEEDEEELPTRSLRRANERKRKREEDVARKVQEKKNKVDAAKSKSSAKWTKLLKDIEKKADQIKECESQIADYDKDLREANCQRTKCLGKDRFWNRYYWFERNGMPFAGMPDSSTAEYGYANGRLWVQGPDATEREGFIDISETLQSNYKNIFGITTHERREKEEGPTHLENADNWGFFDSPEDIDKLIGWLDDHGNREKALKKELISWREDIQEYMLKLREHLEERTEKKNGGAENGVDATPRVSTRHKTYVDLDTTRHMCLAWTNGTARETLGHLHSEPPKPKKRKGVAEKKEKEPAKLKDHGKLVTRGGTKYKR